MGDIPRKQDFHLPIANCLFKLAHAVIPISTGLLLTVGQASATEMKIGDILQDCEVCPKMAFVPAGQFTMSEAKNKKPEKPKQEVNISKPFAISKYEVTWDEWEACMAADGCQWQPDDHRWGRGKMPIINVSWEHANNYVKWLSEKTGNIYRLATEAEWEYAARAGTTTNYWWGDNLKKKHANCYKCGTKWSGKQSAPVGSFPPNPWGIHDMHGNVWEWTADCWNLNQEGSLSHASIRTDGNCTKRVVRGGSWYYYPKLSHSQSRDKFKTDLFSYNIGIRLVRELP